MDDVPPVPSRHLERQSFFQTILNLLLHCGIETHGISPTSIRQRQDKRLYQLFFVWFSANMNILAFSTGSAGPAFFSLGLRDTLVILLGVDIVACAIPAFFAVFGPKLGTRGMVQARFSWGYYGAVLPSILNVFSMQGFLILDCIIGGQALASVSNHLDDTTGIVIITLVSLILTLLGYKFVHWFEVIAWVPNVIAFAVMLGVGGKHLKLSDYPTYPPASVKTITSYITFVAASVVSWCTMAPDYGVYHDAEASSLKIFLYTYAGFVTSNVGAQAIGAAFTAMAPAVPSWNEGFDKGNNLGGLISAILAPVGGFGKFLLALVALSIPSACAPTMYTFGLSFMSISPIFARVPRFAFAIISTAILIPVAIVGAQRFYGTIVNVLNMIGYWSTAFAGIVIAEHVVFRKGQMSLYDVSHWNDPRHLPPGIAAIFSFLVAVGVVIMCMSQAWYTGPVAKVTGDIGVPIAFAVASGIYVFLRLVELKFSSKRRFITLLE